jgi:hypothetical protein
VNGEAKPDTYWELGASNESTPHLIKPEGKPMLRAILTLFIAGTAHAAEPPVLLQRPAVSAKHSPAEHAASISISRVSPQALSQGS